MTPSPNAEMVTEDQGEEVVFYLNGDKHVVDQRTVPADTRLVDYLRTHAKLRGTKVLCREGGCGLCSVVVTERSGDGTRAYSAQACQLYVYNVQGRAVTTIEATDPQNTLLQHALAGFSGTQCGYCSPGMVMTMLGELKRTGSVTSAQVEAALDGNLCRCTGYRPILDAFKSMAGDAAPELKRQLADIEDLFAAKCKNPCGDAGPGACAGKGQHCKKAAPKTSQLGDLAAIPSVSSCVTQAGVQWLHPTDLQSVYEAMTAPTDGKVLLLAGGTGKAVFKESTPYSRYISLDRVTELQLIQTTNAPFEFGARISLTTAIQAFHRAAAGVTPGYTHLTRVAEHWQLVANLAVRNLSSWAGNLVLKRDHPAFPSDIFVTLVACGAMIKICNAVTRHTETVKVADLVSLDLTNVVIISMVLPPCGDGVQFRSFKITRRSVNAHAYVNAAFLFDIDENMTVKQAPTIVFGGINADFCFATRTSAALVGATLSTTAVRGAAGVLRGEVTPATDPSQGGVAYRRDLAVNLLYKAILSIMAEQVPVNVRSGGEKLQRGLNVGKQTFQANKDTWPLGKAIQKIESKAQVSGTAVFVDDVEALHGEVHGVFVTTSLANAEITTVDTAEALARPGVVGYVSAKDVPGENFFHGHAGSPDRVFAEGWSHYHGQPVGLVLASTRAGAVAAAAEVVVTYGERKKPVLTIADGIEQGKVFDSLNFFTGKPGISIKDGEDVDTLLASTSPSNKVSGEVSLGGQFHFHMEPLTCRVAPVEDGWDVLAPTQDTKETQSAVARVLDVPANSVNITVKRIGGGFGGKISRVNLPVSAAAVACRVLRRPVRVCLDLAANMAVVGGREPYHVAYEASFTTTGDLEAVKLRLFSDTGYLSNDSSLFMAAISARHLYRVGAFDVSAKDVRTDTAPNTWCRTPGHVEGVASMETIIEHVAHHLGLDPLVVRVANLPKTKEDGGKEVAGPFVSKILPLLKSDGALEERKAEILAFNKANRWRKRGLSVTPLTYSFQYPGFFKYSVQVSIYEHDGSVAICHGGVEMGQGINTKVVQVAASILGVAVEDIKVKATNTMVGANSAVTGGSFGTDLVCHGTKIACERLAARIAEVKHTLPSPAPAWGPLIKTCFSQDVDLSERYWTSTSEHPKGYDIFAGAIIEVEIDVLTGVMVTRRVDIVEDVGRAISPGVDVGQVEGAFVMGLGLHTTEDVQLCPETGGKLATGTWDYKPPTALDIPEDFRVTFLPDNPNATGVLRSKATGEPPLCLSFGVVTALRAAVAAAREAAGDSSYFQLDTPVTVEHIQQLCLVESSQFSL